MKNLKILCFVDDEEEERREREQTFFSAVSPQLD